MEKQGQITRNQKKYKPISNQIKKKPNTIIDFVELNGRT